MKPVIKNNEYRLLICDLDNTLYDWVSYFVPSFYAMVDSAVKLLNCDRDILLDQFREVHRKHHDSEHPFSLLETKIVKHLIDSSGKKEAIRILDPAFHAFNKSRVDNLKLHHGVIQTFELLKKDSIRIIAHTDSKLFSAIDRVRRLSLEKYIDRIYCRERSVSNHPNGMTFEEWIDGFSSSKLVELSQHQSKPNPSVLREICQRECIDLEHAVYVGDSLSKDIVMAKEAGVFAVWAEYGANHKKSDYQKLIRISHWTENDIKREKDLGSKAKSIKPDFIAQRSFSEILEVFS